MDFQLIFLIASFVGIISGIWKISSDLRHDLDETKKLLFNRFDDHKQDTDRKLFIIQSQTDDKYVRMDLCNKTSGNIEGRLKSIDIKLDTLLQERRRDL